MKKSISTDLNAENIKTVLEILAKIPGDFEHLSADLSPEQLKMPLGTGERSFAESLAHVLHCEEQATHFVYTALMLKEPLMLKIHPERNLGKLWQLQQFDVPELLAYFKFRRKLLLTVLESISEKQWSRVVREENKKRKESVYLMARGTALHELEHVTDIEAKLPGMLESSG